jgi:6-phosphogluconolactonase (cycloisomerase 2 family)
MILVVKEQLYSIVCYNSDKGVIIFPVDMTWLFLSQVHRTIIILTWVELHQNVNDFYSIVKEQFSIVCYNSDKGVIIFPVDMTWLFLSQVHRTIIILTWVELHQNVNDFYSIVKEQFSIVCYNSDKGVIMFPVDMTRLFLLHAWFIET